MNRQAGGRKRSSDPDRVSVREAVRILGAGGLIVACALLFMHQMSSIRGFAALGDRVEAVGADGTALHTAMNTEGDLFFAPKTIERWTLEGIDVAALHINDYSRATRDLYQWNRLLLLVYLVCMFAVSAAGIRAIAGIVRRSLRIALVDHYWRDYRKQNRRAVLAAALSLVLLSVLALLVFAAIDSMRFELSLRAAPGADIAGRRIGKLSPLIAVSDYGRAYESLAARLRTATAAGSLAAVGAAAFAIAQIRASAGKYLKREENHGQG